jgi:hypothetical protein
VVIAGVLLAVVAYIALRRPGHETSDAAGSASTGGAATRAPAGPQLGGADPKDPQVVSKFQERKARAMPRLLEELQLRLHQCRGGGSALPSGPPRSVNVILIRDDKLSTPELQRYVVDGVNVVDAAIPLSVEASRCLDQLRGATLNVLLPSNEVPRGSTQLNEVVPLPLP